jgi:transcriptional regulator of acetoin/glycerol metabolism
MRGGNNTTVPGANGRGVARDQHVLAIRWLFPAQGSGDSPVTAPTRADRVIIGRGEDCGTVLLGAEISRQHAELALQGPMMVLRDLGSMNGTFVNGRLVGETPLDPGDVVRLGEWIGVAVALPIAAADAPPQYATIAPGLMGGGALRAAVDPALRAAASDLAIIIEGETGTGKEVLARAVHARSGRSGGFLAVNCAALPEPLAEAELFGYRRGAFTGAERASAGYFRSAAGGTLLLDEITDLPLSLQAKVLRVLEQREVVPLGESQPVAIDVRVIVAGQESLERAVAEKRFRPDLYARLEGLTVRLPPLRERVDEVPYLFARLLHDVSGGRPPAVEPALVERLCLYDWPFNVRELVTLVKRMLVLHGHEATLRLADLPPRFLADKSGESGATPSGRGARRDDDAELARLLAALRHSDGNVSRAAAAIGVSRQRAYRLMQARPDIDLDGLRGGDDKPERDVP